MIKFIIPTILGALFVWSLYDDLTSEKGFLFTGDGELNWPTVIGLGLMALAFVIAVTLAKIGKVNYGNTGEKRDA